MVKHYFNKPLTPEEKAYYTPTDIDYKLAQSPEIDSDRVESISAMAMCDIIVRRNKRTLKDFNSKAEYESYKLALKEAVITY